jgi:mannan endo-1,4-beta-mannosidase
MTPSKSNCQGGDPQGWVCGRAGHLRKLLGSNTATLVSTGGLGGDISHSCTFLATATQCDAVDVISIHRYASVPGKWSDSLSGWISQSKGKKVYIEEWGIDSTKYDQKSAYASETKNMNSVGLPNLYWQILPPVASGCSYSPESDSGDHFGIFDDSAVDFATAINGATGVGAAQDWTGSVY